MSGSEGEKKSGYQGWDVKEACNYLRVHGIDDFMKLNRDENLPEINLPDQQVSDLEELGVSTDGEQSKPAKVFNDPIHGNIEMDPLLVRIIDTPQFQRLRNIKQLGGTYFVYPGASHNRFEHSIGVGYLAGQLVKTLNERQPKLDINNRDILCVQIAGLCHDLGHGPFSHVFDNQFIPHFQKGNKWKHENASLDMFDHLINSNGLWDELKKHGLVLPQDVVFIKELIKSPTCNGEWPYKGRPKEKGFLYDIVANKTNGIDVDKWDYFTRDSYHLGMKNNFDSARLLKFARVCKVGEVMHICFRDKEVGNLYDMFNTRYILHWRAYQHRVVKIVELMIKEALVLADPYIEIIGTGEKIYKMSTAIEDMVAYTKLTDNILQQILNSSKPQLQEAQKILNNILHRKLYKFIGQIRPEAEAIIQPEDFDKLAGKVAAVEPSSSVDVKFTANDFIVNVVLLDYGMKEKDPIEKVWFYSKTDPDKAIKIPKDQVPQLITERFSEQLIQVYCKRTDKPSLEAAQKHFEQWCSNRNFTDSKDDDEGTAASNP
uniref:deoxynucleoside triphosphate triphosphohydrolase SAMHD1-like n=1 Tax=Pristiophorus japonicus TaxID=55135 RepID=UPI00398EA516